MKYFPEMYRTFCHGELSLCLERFGGIDALSLLDVEKQGDLILPDQNCTPIFSRQASLSMGRQLFSSALRLTGESKPGGQVGYFFPGNPEIAPWAVSGEGPDGTFELLIRNHAVSMRCTSETMRIIKFWISSDHLADGPFNSWKNQRLSPVEQKHLQRIGEAYDVTDPIPNGQALNTWNHKPDFDGRCLVFHGVTAFPYGDREIHVAMAMGTANGMTLENLDGGYCLVGDFPDGGIVDSAIAVAHTAEEARRQALLSVTSFDADKAALRQDYQERLDRAPTLCIDGMPLAGQFMREVPNWIAALTVGNGVGVRASSHFFGFFPLWDAIWPIRDFLWNNQPDEAETMLRYLIAYPHMEAQPWASLQLICQANEYLAYREDPDLVAFALPMFRRAINLARRLCNPQSGLLVSLANSANDKPEETGLQGFYAASCVNGFWYDALRVMENLECQAGNRDRCMDMRQWADRVARHYLPTFYMPDPGYLRLAVREDMTAYPDDIYQNSNTIGLDYIFGPYLMRKIIRPLANYQATRLYHPLGRTAVAADSPVKCEMWKGVHMNQHNGHEMKLARMADDMPEAYRVMNAYLQAYGQYGVAVETFNYCGCLGNEQQNANWQAFSATAAATAIRTGLVGIGVHRGGMFYLPADDAHQATVTHVTVRQVTYDLNIQGHGQLARLNVDGNDLPGTLQLPADLPTAGHHRITVTRCHELTDGIPLLLAALDLPVTHLQAAHGRLAFTAGASGRFPIHFQLEGPAMATVNGTPVEGEYDADARQLWLDLPLKADDRIQVTSI